jgi:hypothetical protein
MGFSVRAITLLRVDDSRVDYSGGRAIKRLFRWASDEEDYLPENGIWRLKLPARHIRQVEPYTDAEVLARQAEGRLDDRKGGSRIPWNRVTSEEETRYLLKPGLRRSCPAGSWPGR